MNKEWVLGRRREEHTVGI